MSYGTDKYKPLTKKLQEAASSSAMFGLVSDLFTI